MLTRLTLSHNAALGDVGIEAIAEGLAGRRAQLKQLDVTACSLTDRGLVAIVRHLLLPAPPRLPAMRRLFLNGNEIALDPSGPCPSLLASALSHPSSRLSLLNLTNNPLVGLADFLQHATPRALAFLHLNACKLPPSDGHALVNWLSSPTNTLVSLELNANRLDEAVLLALHDLVAKGQNPCLARLEVAANEAGYSGAQQTSLSMILARNRTYSLLARDAATKILPLARIFSHAREGAGVARFPLLKLPSELRTYLLRCIAGDALSRRQMARVLRYAEDRGTLSRWRRVDDADGEAKETFLIETGTMRWDGPT